MSDTTTVVLAVTASVLVLGIGAYLLVNPMVAVGLPPILMAIGYIIRSIRGSDSRRRRRGERR